MKIYPIETGNFKLDGGAMFGVVPKSLWSRSKSADENNMCSWSMRCMLIEDGKRLILIDTGIGNKQNEKFFSHFYLFGEDTLENSLKQLGFGMDDITDVFLTHLHFDHCGGAINFNKSKNRLEPAFPNAHYWSNKNHWDWAIEPNAREKASFLKENILPIQESGQLKFIERDGMWSKGDVFEDFKVFFVDGHTESQMIPYISYQDKTLVYAADLIPSAAHIPLPYVMGYDVRPLETLKEKKICLDSAVKENHVLFLEHDIDAECALVEETERGIRLKHTARFSEIFG